MPGSSTVVPTDIESVRLQSVKEPLAYFRHQLPNGGLFVRREFVNARDVFAWRDQCMALGNGVGVGESNRVLVLGPFALSSSEQKGQDIGARSMLVTLLRGLCCK
jgi:hypothetical protein